MYYSTDHCVLVFDLKNISGHQMEVQHAAVLFVLDQQIFSSASSLKQQSTDRHVSPLEHIILILSQPVLNLLVPAMM
jgi:hypothetical protein